MTSPRRPLSRLTRRLLSTGNQSSTAPPRPQHDPYALLSRPTWSIRALLPPSPSNNPPSHPVAPLSEPTTEIDQPPSENDPQITPQQLTHLLRLSALPQPPTQTTSHRLLTTLHAQLHFVRDMQRVNTAGVAPLHSIRDETPQGLLEATVTTSTLAEALQQEEVVGRCRRPRRRRTGKGGGQIQMQIEGVEDWDVLAGAGEKVGRYFVVRSGKGEAAKEGGE
ncbi:hypothetical protein C8A01DRAFT_40467 [Parachaetomium inaequale]|uniref:Glutamyl-tRNA amidotransferase complex subunit Gta3 domain-containing protein n=1 Tax=Parachaetomium inaequale TaxID=2588326 RepID=A0AAN6P7B2_9PEZI|nr:hypothetical protein C8A01DRAFT_40467 [Parachaetomium inaequale]